MQATDLYGTYTALITPFKEDLSIDFASLDRIVDAQLSSGIEGLVILGSTAEAQTLSLEDKIAVMLRIQERVDGKIPIIVGTGSNDTRATIKFTKLVSDYGFEGVLLVAPYYNKPSQEGLYRHFLSISENVDIKMVIYNIPGRSVVNILPHTVQKISANCKNIIGIKESSGDITQIMEVISVCSSDFAILCGDDSLAVPSIFMGTRGVISVLSNYAPIQFGECIRLALRGEIFAAKRLHYDLLGLMNINFIETNPSPVKAIMKELGLIDSNSVRLPLVPLSFSGLEAIRGILLGRKVD